MIKLGHIELYVLLIQLIALLGVSKFFGELTRRFKQPAVIGEIIGGIFIGPTIFGTFAPSLFQSLFIDFKAPAVVLDGIATISLIFLLFFVGLGINIAFVKQQGKALVALGALGVTIPFALGYPVGWILYPTIETSLTRHLFAMFMGSALSISALPVIARVLLDLNLLESKIGALIAAVATVNDIVGWLIFTLAIGISGSGGKGLPIGMTIGVTVFLTLFSVTVMRDFMNWLLKRVAHFFPGTGGVIGLLMVLMLSAGLCTEYLGIHAVFGSLLVGIAVNGSPHITSQIKESINMFTVHVLAPLFFAAVGLKVNFVSNFNLSIVLIVLTVAYVSKMLAGCLGGWIAGLSKHESMAIGFGMTARGIILAIVAFDAHVIGPELFEALIIMALMTSLTSGLLGHFIPSQQ